MSETYEGNRHYEANVEFWNQPENKKILNDAKTKLESKGAVVEIAPDGGLYAKKPDGDWTYHISVGSGGVLTPERRVNNEGLSKDFSYDEWPELFE